MREVVRSTIDRPGPTLMMGLWLWFTVVYFAFFYIFQDAREIADSNLDGYLEVILLGIPSVVLLAGAVWLRESYVEEDLKPRAVGWTVGMALFFVVAMYTALFVIETRFDPGEQWLILLLSMGFGASSGTVMGILKIRTVQRERERDRSRLLAQRRKRERQQLEYLNQYLRHEVLNETNKIGGFAELLRNQAGDDTDRADWLATIQDSSQEIAEFIRSIREILDASEHNPDLTPIDVMELLDEVEKRTRRIHPETSIEISGPDSVYILAGDLVDRAFQNLVDNAVEHNEDPITIDIWVKSADGSVSIWIEDNGSGLEDVRYDGIFEPPDTGDHGYGLFLTNNLVEVYGGRLKLERTGMEGTAFIITFAEAAPPEQSSLFPTQGGFPG